MQDHHRLVVWQKARALASLTYRTTESLPNDERFGLKVQMRRAAVSIPSNIAEGAGRGGDRDFARFLRIAYGSACELETQALLACDVGVAPPEDLERVIASTNEVRRMLNALIHRVSEQS